MPSDDAATTALSLTVREAADRLGMTPQAVRNAASDGRLAAATKTLPNGRRSFEISEAAVEAFERSRDPATAERLENIRLNLDLAIADLHARDLRISQLENDLANARHEIERLKDAVLAQMDAAARAVGVAGRVGA